MSNLSNKICWSTQLIIQQNLKNWSTNELNLSPVQWSKKYLDENVAFLRVYILIITDNRAG